MDFSAFTRLEKLSINHAHKHVTLPAHKLRRFRICPVQKDFKDPLALFPPECAERIVLFLHTLKSFSKVTARTLPPNVRVLCSEAGAGISPETFFPPRFTPKVLVQLTDAFVFDQFRMLYHQTQPVFRDVTLEF